MDTKVEEDLFPKIFTDYEVREYGIREKYKRQGYGHRQLEEAVRRIKEQ